MLAMGSCLLFSFILLFASEGYQQMVDSVDKPARGFVRVGAI